MQNTATQAALSETELAALQSDPRTAREALAAKERAASTRRAHEEQQRRDAAAQAARAVAEAEAARTETTRRAAEEAAAAELAALKAAQLAAQRLQLVELDRSLAGEEARIATSVREMADASRAIEAIAKRRQALNAASGGALFPSIHNLEAIAAILDPLVRRIGSQHRGDGALLGALHGIASVVRGR
jgi:hypothetical protein